jgi:putative CocE/NonD family hydrolase
MPLAKTAALAMSALALCGGFAAAQDIAFPAPGGPFDKAMPDIARAVLAANKADPETIFRVQIAAGDDTAAGAVLRALTAPRANNSSPLVRARDLPYAIYVRARIASAKDPAAFDQAYAKEFRATMAALDNRTAAVIVNDLAYDNLSQAKRALDGDIAGQKGKNTIPAEAASQLVRDYADVQMYGAIAPDIATLLAEDDARRYETAGNIQVSTPDHAVVCALVVRPRNAPRLPALLEFTIYNDAGSILREARRAASNDYVGVVGLTRGKGCSEGPIAPYEHDGADADALIGWIATQPWSDGRVGMYGGSYSGFTPWAAAKHKPTALKAIMVGAPGAPGIDSPMEGNIFWNFIYPWPFYTADNKTLDNAGYNDNARWQKLDRDWYVSGRPYRDLDKIDGTPNPIFDRWLSHGGYDAYWQSLIPYRREFANIRIPVLITAGYYYGGPAAATYYFEQYRKYDPKADVALVVGPYDHFLAQRGTASPDGDTTSLNGYTLDPAALQNFADLRFAWFDYVLKGRPRPALLADRVNYEVMGADLWKHAPSLAAMARSHLRFHLNGARDGKAYRLSDRAAGGALMQTIDFKDRSDADAQAPGGGVLDKDIDLTNALEFIAEPLAEPVELSGLFSGHLELVTNKKDFDFQIALYAQMPDGRYLQLAPYQSRASFVAGLSRRSLLVPGRAQTMDFRAIRLMSARLPAGCRLVAVLGVIKNPGQEIDYGTGGVVSAESIAEAGAPLTIRWSPRSYIDLPLGR